VQLIGKQIVESEEKFVKDVSTFMREGEERIATDVKNTYDSLGKQVSSSSSPSNQSSISVKESAM
jgi:hypothetical protein